MSAETGVLQQWEDMSLTEMTLKQSSRQQCGRVTHRNDPRTGLSTTVRRSVSHKTDPPTGLTLAVWRSVIHTNDPQTGPTLAVWR